MKVALIGLPQSGKSTILAAMSGKAVPAMGATDISEAMVPVPDERIDWLAAKYNPQKTTLATIDCLDLPGVSFSDDTSRANARKLINKVRTVDMIVMVVRAFTNPAVPAYRGTVDPGRDIAELKNELLLTDLELITTRIDRLEKQAGKPSKTQGQDQAELALHKKLSAAIEADQPLSSLALNEAETKLINSINFLTLKPLAVVVNTDEKDLNKKFSFDLPAAIPLFSLAATLELELAQLDEADRTTFMAELGLTTPAAKKFIASCYAALGLISFLTCGPDEVRAWTIRKGLTAWEAAGKIHSDIQRGFIRAETMTFDLLKELGDEKAVRAAGKVRLEGKTYVVQDGDIMDFRFNV